MKLGHNATSQDAKYTFNLKGYRRPAERFLGAPVMTGRRSIGGRDRGPELRETWSGVAVGAGTTPTGARSARHPSPAFGSRTQT